MLSHETETEMEGRGKKEQFYTCHRTDMYNNTFGLSQRSTITPRVKPSILCGHFYITSEKNEIACL